MGAASAGELVGVCLQRGDWLGAGDRAADELGAGPAMAGGIRDGQRAYAVGFPGGASGGVGRAVCRVAGGAGRPGVGGPGAGDARRDQDPGASRSGHIPAGEDAAGAGRTGASSGPADGRRLGGGCQRPAAGGAAAGGTGTAAADGISAESSARAPGREEDCGGKSGGASERNRAGSAHHEAGRLRLGAQLQRADQHGRGAQGHRGGI